MTRPELIGQASYDGVDQRGTDTLLARSNNLDLIKFFRIAPEDVAWSYPVNGLPPSSEQRLQLHMQPKLTPSTPRFRLAVANEFVIGAFGKVDGVRQSEFSCLKTTTSSGISVEPGFLGRFTSLPERPVVIELCRVCVADRESAESFESQRRRPSLSSGCVLGHPEALGVVSTPRCLPSCTRTFDRDDHLRQVYRGVANSVNTPGNPQPPVGRWVNGAQN
jgi:hypothetical protein